ncbi:MAG: UDP-N-acetylglucosamine 1-carboxyvinyltransferase [Patescibacteria group bacterium]|mgnify:CR=1 FL=1
MAEITIQGGQRLNGTVSLSGAKNSAFKLMIASLLSHREVNLTNVCRIADVELVKEIILQLGGQVKADANYFKLQADNLQSFTVPQSLGQASRASSLFLAPLLARFQQAIMPLPGGDQIGERRLNWHFAGLQALGAKIKLKNQLIYATCPVLKGGNYTFPEPTHTGTETLIMAAVLARGKTILKNCALEPEVDDLIAFLTQMGAKITRQAPRTIIINGVKDLGSASYSVMPDRNEAVSYAIAALITQGNILVKHAREQDLTAFLTKLTEIGAGFKVLSEGIRFYYHQPLRAVNIKTAPHPGFMTDWQPLWSVLATQFQGQSQVTDTIFPHRFQFVPLLLAMGAKISQMPGSIKIIGPAKLQGQKLTIPDIRAGATLVLAGLCARGETVLTGVEHLNRGYENFIGHLQALGAKINNLQGQSL